MLFVNLPDPSAPKPEDAIEKGNEFSAWLANQGSAFWTIVFIAIMALVVMSLLKRAFVRGLVVGVIILIVAGIALEAL